MTELEPTKVQVAIGIDFGATNLKTVIIDKEGTIYNEYIEPSLSQSGPDSTLKRISETLDTAVGDASSAGMEVVGVGIGACGPIDFSRTEIVESPVLPGWSHVPIVDFLRKSSGLPVFLDNDANLAILGEWWMGAGDRKDVVAGITLGTGIGGGLVLGGKIYRGAFGYGAEFGHIRVADSPPCPCGNKGCLGRVASAKATLKRYRLFAKEGDAPVENMGDLKTLYETGLPAAVASISQSINYICKAVLILINCLNPNVFIFTGGMTILGDILLSPVREYIAASTFKNNSSKIDIRTGSLGMYSGAYGAGYLVFSRL